MNAARPIKLLSIAFGALLLLAAPAAHAAPPNGDVFAQPVAIKLNEHKTITGVEQATVQVGAFEYTSCDASEVSTRSVWFGFTMPVGGMVELSAVGTWFIGNNSVRDLAVISVRRMDTLNGTHVICASGSSPRIAPIFLAAGEYRVRIATVDAAPVTGPSQARLSLRVHSLDNFLDDPNFSEPLGAEWKAKKAGSPPLVTRECPALCHIHFGGKAGASIKNSVAWPAGIKAKTGDFLLVAVEINGTPVDGADIKIGLTISYSDGSVSKGTIVRRIFWTSTVTAFTVAGIPTEVTRKQVSKITATITSPAASDVFNVRSVGLNLFAGVGVRGAELLTVPPGP